MTPVGGPRLLRRPRPELALVLIGVAVGGGIGALAVRGDDGPPRNSAGLSALTSPAPAHEPTLEQIAADELVRSRLANRRLAPTLERAKKIAREVQPRYRLRDGRRLDVAEVGTTLAVAAMSLVTDVSGPARSIRTDKGIYFAICPAGGRCPYPGAAGVPASGAVPRRLGLELAVRTFVETEATLVVVSLPAAEPVMLVFERKDLLHDLDVRTLLRSLSQAAPVGEELVDRLTGPRLFTPSGLVPLSDTRDSLVVSRLGISAAVGSADSG